MIRNRSYTDKTHLRGFQLVGVHVDGLSLCSRYVFLPEPLTQPKLAIALLITKWLKSYQRRGW
ncbi:MAG: hypothetical protein HWQ43_01345 [Nostoc sp. JL31]|uniref:hypothetical protein n=1 Tax=Nostoc sp. JL31 TaxID=2815395 RepID=UPI0025FF4915|nr:hypothetical protein [Nostoc sp. JL31]MBN3887865.1 hypothetical protein [Nostoc sp. JL31]